MGIRKKFKSTVDVISGWVDTLFPLRSSYTPEGGVVPTTVAPVYEPTPLAVKFFDQPYSPEDPLKPLYFIMHPDNTYSVADPQPPTLPEDWTGVKAKQAGVQKLIDQLKFLLSQAPMIEIPKDADARRLASSVTKYAYVHPTTFTKATGIEGSATTPYSVIFPSPTIWVRTELMPEGCVIYSPNAMPGVGA
jgi:hypothetical protein